MAIPFMACDRISLLSRTMAFDKPFRWKRRLSLPALSIVVLVQCSRTAPAEFANLKGLATMIEGIVGSSRYEVAVVSYGEHTECAWRFLGQSGRLARNRVIQVNFVRRLRRRDGRCR